MGYTPLFCDLDLDNEISVPGSIGATVVDHLVPNGLLFDNGISYFFGDVYNKNGFKYNNRKPIYKKKRKYKKYYKK